MARNFHRADGEHWEIEDRPQSQNDFARGNWTHITRNRDRPAYVGSSVIRDEDAARVPLLRPATYSLDTRRGINVDPERKYDDIHPTNLTITYFE